LQQLNAHKEHSSQDMEYKVYVDLDGSSFSICPSNSPSTVNPATLSWTTHSLPVLVTALVRLILLL